MNQLSRRHFVQSAAFASAAPFLLDVAPAAAQDASTLNRFPRMVQEYYVARMRAIFRRSAERRAALKTQADAQAYVTSVRNKIQQSFGPWPEKTPLNSRITGTVERDAYRIENVVFESRPGFYVTANLYLPKGTDDPRPAVVGTCGHSSNGKAAEAYQSFAQGLARQGYVCLIYDPIGQGERLQYPDDSLKSRVGVGVREHLYAGNQQSLVGEFFGSWRAWDGIRALDYLLTREEVDERHVGVTGNSGGGTMTTWLCGVESRWTMAAPSCFVTSFLRNMENELPADTEQCPPKVLELGLDHLDFLAAMAPKPVIILAKEGDYFDARGSEYAFRELRKIYRLLGATDKIGLNVAPGGHGYAQNNREAMYGWFHQATGQDRPSTEPSLTFEKDETLYCAPDGQVAKLDSRSVFSFTQATSQALAKPRKTDWQREDLAKTIQQTLGWSAFPSANRPPRYRILRPRNVKDYPQRYATSYVVETEPRASAIVYRLSDSRVLSRPPASQAAAILYVSHHSADYELRTDKDLHELFNGYDDRVRYSCDPRGIGESRPNTCNENSFLSPYGNDYFYAAHAIMMGQSTVAQRTWDVVRVIDWLKQIGHTDVVLAASGWGSVPATLAAVICNSVTELKLKNELESFQTIAESETYEWPLSGMLPGVLKSFDLPDCRGVVRSSTF